MKDSKQVRIPEPERHHLEAGKTAAASERQLWIRQDWLYDQKKDIKEDIAMRMDSLSPT